MPVVSQAQRRWAFATAEGKTDTAPSVGRDFISKSHGITGLPNHVHNGKPESEGAHDHDADEATERGKRQAFMTVLHHALTGRK